MSFDKDYINDQIVQREEDRLRRANRRAELRSELKRVDPSSERGEKILRELRTLEDDDF